MTKLQDHPLFGKIALGWTAESWIDRLRMVADRCRKDHPQLAEDYEEWIQILQDSDRDGD